MAVRSHFQSHPFHLVSPSPWPLYTSLCLFSLTTTGALSMHSFSGSYNISSLAFFVLVFSMSLWFRDIISEGKPSYTQYIWDFFYLNTVKAIPAEDVKQALDSYNSSSHIIKDKENLGYYLAGLLEGDGHISLPFLGTTGLNRVLNPRIVFTTHINNLGMYALIQSLLGNIGRFQTSNNILRYIIGDKDGILLFINLIHNKLRTPKNKRLNDTIQFLNGKYSLNISESLLDVSDFSENSWFTGFTEADGHFGIKYVESLPKTETKRSRSESVSLKFRLDQRAYDKSTSSSMLPFMKKLALFLNCEVKNYNSNATNSEILSLSLASIHSIKFLKDYFDKYPLLGEKKKDYDKWTSVYNMIVSKQHLTKEGRLKIKSLLRS